MFVHEGRVSLGYSQPVKPQMLTRWQGGKVRIERRQEMSSNMGFLASTHDEAFDLKALCDLCLFATI